MIDYYALLEAMLGVSIGSLVVVAGVLLAVFVVDKLRDEKRGADDDFLILIGCPLFSILFIGMLSAVVSLFFVLMGW